MRVFYANARQHSSVEGPGKPLDSKPSSNSSFATPDVGASLKIMIQNGFKLKKGGLYGNGRLDGGVASAISGTTLTAVMRLEHAHSAQTLFPALRSFARTAGRGPSQVRFAGPRPGSSRYSSASPRRRQSALCKEGLLSQGPGKTADRADRRDYAAAGAGPRRPRRATVDYPRLGRTRQPRLIEFFTASIRNRNTRIAYAARGQAVLDWCNERRLKLADIEAITVAT